MLKQGWGWLTGEREDEEQEQERENEDELARAEREATEQLEQKKAEANKAWRATAMLLALGTALVLGGLWWAWPPAALMLGGLLAAGAGLMMGTVAVGMAGKVLSYGAEISAMKQLAAAVRKAEEEAERQARAEAEAATVQEQAREN